MLDVLASTPKSLLGLTVAVDIIITSIRNILIRRLAEHGVYVFSWQGVLNMAAALGQIKIEDKAVFLHARKIKNVYRRQGH